MKALFINGSPNKNGIQQFLQRIYSEIRNMKHVILQSIRYTATDSLLKRMNLTQ